MEFLFLLSKVNGKEIAITNSFVLQEENSKNPFINRKDKINDLLSLSSDYISYSKKLENRAKEIG